MNVRPEEISNIIKEQIKQETEAYEMPSMFAGDSSIMEDDFGVL